MVEAVMLWNEPNNLSHWDFKIDPDWKMFADMAIAGARAVRRVNPELKIVLGGISPIDPNFIQLHGVPRRAGRGRCGRRARLSAGLEPLEHSRMAGEDRGDPRRDAESRSGCRRRAHRRLAPKRCRSSACRRRPNCCCRWSIACTGTACSTCPRPGRPPPATRNRKAAPTTGTTTWD